MKSSATTAVGCMLANYVLQRTSQTAQAQAQAQASNQLILIRAPVELLCCARG